MPQCRQNPSVRPGRPFTDWPTRCPQFPQNRRLSGTRGSARIAVRRVAGRDRRHLHQPGAERAARGPAAAAPRAAGAAPAARAPAPVPAVPADHDADPWPPLGAARAARARTPRRSAALGGARGRRRHAADRAVPVLDHSAAPRLCARGSRHRRPPSLSSWRGSPAGIRRRPSRPPLGRTARSTAGRAPGRSSRPGPRPRPPRGGRPWPCTRRAGRAAHRGWRVRPPRTVRSPRSAERPPPARRRTGQARSRAGSTGPRPRARSGRQAAVRRCQAAAAAAPRSARRRGATP